MLKNFLLLEVSTLKGNDILFAGCDHVTSKSEASYFINALNFPHTKST